MVGKIKSMNQENKTPHNFCETPEEKCTMNYCDENGCQNRERHLVSENNQLPTAEEELMDAENTLFRHVSKVYNLSDVIDAMEEHTRLHTASLLEELEKLRAENERLKNIISGYESSLKDYDVERKHLINQTQKLREALERIIIEKEDSEQVSCEDIIENMVQIAENTLKSENK